MTSKPSAPSTTETPVNWWVVACVALVTFLLFSDNKGTPFKEDSMVEGGYVVLIFEHGKKTADQELLLSGMGDFVTANKLTGYRAWDDDLDSAKPYIDFGKTKKIEPPLAAYVKDKDIKKVVKLTGEKRDLEAVLK